jgi:aminopeptidase-like protein
LESTNPNPAPNAYSRVVCWIDNDSLGIVEAYAYDARGRKLKNFYPKNLEKVNGQYQVESMVMENLQTGSRSVLEFDLNK